MFFLYHPRSCVTGRVIGRALGLRRAMAARRVPVNTDVLIRWGNAQTVPGFIEEGAINDRLSISNASNKLRALRTMQDAGVRVPEFATTIPAGDNGTWLGRDISGFGGRDIVVYDLSDGGEPPYGGQHAFFTRYITPRFEARIHVAFGEVIRVQKKYLDHPELQRSEHIRNYANGYRFKTPQRRLNDSRTEAAVNAVESLGLDFGAVDLLVGLDGQEYVLEVNTAPKCSPLTGRAYAEAFGVRLGIPVRLEELEGLSGAE